MTLEFLPIMLLVVIAVEAFVLRRWIVRAPGILFGLLSGASLVLALGAALLQFGFAAIAVCVTLSLVFHLLELRQWLIITKQQPA